MIINKFTLQQFPAAARSSLPWIRNVCSTTASFQTIHLGLADLFALPGRYLRYSVLFHLLGFGQLAHFTTPKMSDEDHVSRSPCRLHLVGAHGDSSTAPSQSVDELTTNHRELKMATSLSSSYTDHAHAPFSTSQPDKTVGSSSRHSRSS